MLPAGHQADYTALVSQQVLSSSGTAAAAPGSSPPPPGSSGGKNFPGWTIALIVILVVALLAIVAGAHSLQGRNIHASSCCPGIARQGHALVSVKVPSDNNFPLSLRKGML